MPAPYSGRCVCGAVAYRLTDEPLTVYVCHCTDCQKRSGSAFSMSMWVHRSALALTAGEPVSLTLTTPSGRVAEHRLCAKCGCRLWSEPRQRPEIAIVRPGTLEDTSWIRPVAHLWTRSAQPWVGIPEGVPRYETQPAEFGELFELMRAAGRRRTD